MEDIGRLEIKKLLGTWVIVRGETHKLALNAKFYDIEHAEYVMQLMGGGKSPVKVERIDGNSSTLRKLKGD